MKNLLEKLRWLRDIKAERIKSLEESSNFIAAITKFIGSIENQGHGFIKPDWIPVSERPLIANGKLIFEVGSHQEFLARFKTGSVHWCWIKQPDDIRIGNLDLPYEVNDITDYMIIDKFDRA